METEEVEFVEVEHEKWAVYAKNSTFPLGAIAWSDDKKAFDYIPNSNGKLMKITQREISRRELLAFCKEQTDKKIEQGGNK